MEHYNSGALTEKPSLIKLALSRLMYCFQKLLIYHYKFEGFIHVNPSFQGYIQIKCFVIISHLFRIRPLFRHAQSRDFICYNNCTLQL